MVVVVIGGGIVGCFVAREMVTRSEEVFLVEKEKALGEHTSTRNSGVIHGGIYYAYGSLKAKLCLRGRYLTYEILRDHKIPHRKCGKLILALSEKEVEELEDLRDLGERNGVENLELIDGTEARKIEPRVRCMAALHSPESGLVDMASYMRAMERLLKRVGVTVVKECEVLTIGDKNLLRTTRGEIEADVLINAAGLHSDTIAEMCGLEGYEIVPYKGDYYNTTERVVEGLVYPVPGSTLGLGIHLTPTFGEEILIGPSVLRGSEKEDYEIRTPREELEQGARAMIPDLDPQRMYPGFSGNRPKVFYRGELQTDFIIEKQGRGRIHLLGIESPGLTAAPALAEYVAEMIA
ncbi:MAG: FAD-dependent oxidoreductase [Proteobacteria bacterium]|nr:FAD-dependent oxidoreductase [Pseudomonadota bacterium]